MIIQAELKCKQTGCEADPCAVDKVIELPSQRFQQFSRALLADYDFIAENKNAIRHDEDARHCLLMGYTVLLCFTLFKTGSMAKSIFHAH